MKSQLIILFLTCLFFSCQKDGITKEKLDEKIELSDIRKFEYMNDSIKSEVFTNVPQILLLNSLPITKPDLKYRLEKKGNKVRSIVYLLDKYRISVNNRKLNKPYISINSALSEKGTYLLEYKHGLDDEIFESIYVNEKNILHRQNTDSTSVYRYYKLDGDFIEWGSTSKEETDTTYMNSFTLFKTLIDNSSPIIEKK